jgi:hypothetical protein
VLNEIVFSGFQFEGVNPMVISELFRGVFSFFFVRCRSSLPPETNDDFMFGETVTVNFKFFSCFDVEILSPECL